MRILLAAIIAAMLCSTAFADECLTFASTAAAEGAKTISFSIEGEATLRELGKPDLRFNTAGAGTGIEGRALIPINAPASGEMIYVERGDQIIVEGEAFAPACEEPKP